MSKLNEHFQKSHVIFHMGITISLFCYILNRRLFLWDPFSYRLEEDDEIKTDSMWSPNMQTTFKILASARFCAAIWNNIQDCDETFNFWEPVLTLTFSRTRSVPKTSIFIIQMHYLLYGSGFQTWEYSPIYALRSYIYILIHALPAWFYGLIFQSNRVLVFYFIRCVLGFFCTAFETYFYR